MSTNQSILLYNATKASFEAERDEALAVMSIFLENPSGVAEHNGFVEEIKAATKRLAEAEECLKALKDNFGYITGDGDGSAMVTLSEPDATGWVDRA